VIDGQTFSRPTVQLTLPVEEDGWIVARPVPLTLRILGVDARTG
jgi:hypothetical protein